MVVPCSGVFHVRSWKIHSHKMVLDVFYKKINAAFVVGFSYILQKKEIITVIFPLLRFVFFFLKD